MPCQPRHAPDGGALNLLIGDQGAITLGRAGHERAPKHVVPATCPIHAGPAGPAGRPKRGGPPSICSSQGAWSDNVRRCCAWSEFPGGPGASPVASRRHAEDLALLEQILLETGQLRTLNDEARPRDRQRPRVALGQLPVGNLCWRSRCALHRLGHRPALQRLGQHFAPGLRRPPSCVRAGDTLARPPGRAPCACRRRSSRPALRLRVGPSIVEFRG
jgi:hypothetical protein